MQKTNNQANHNQQITTQDQELVSEEVNEVTEEAIAEAEEVKENVNYLTVDKFNEFADRLESMLQSNKDKEQPKVEEAKPETDYQKMKNEIKLEMMVENLDENQATFFKDNNINPSDLSLSVFKAMLRALGKGKEKTNVRKETKTKINNSVGKRKYDTKQMINEIAKELKEGKYAN